jgi:hypothetical protein
VQTLTVYPDPGSGATTVNSRVARAFPGTTQETLAVMRAGAGNLAVIDTDYTFAFFLGGQGEVDKFDELDRSILTFDTSPLGAAATIVSAVLSLNFIFPPPTGGDVGYGTNTTVEIVSSAPASDNNVVESDYGTLGSVSFASMSLDAIQPSVYNDFVLNSSGRAQINKTGITRLGTRSGWDLNNNFTGTWVESTGTDVPYWGASTSGTSQDPKLTITYYLPPAINKIDFRKFPKRFLRR